MSVAPSALPPLDSWQIINIETIAFPAQPQIETPQNWLSDFTGGDTESTIKRLERRDRVTLGNRVVKLTIDPLRIYWTAGPNVLADELVADGLQQVPSLGGYSEVRDWFCGMMRQWVQAGIPEIKRLAFATKIIQPAPSREDAYRMLQPYIPHVEIDPESTDFQYRVNRKRTSRTGIPNLVINRLSNWSAMQIEIQMSVSLTADTAVQHEIPSAPVYACLLSLDVNTHQTFGGPLPSAQIADVFDELVDLSEEIAIRGDIR